MQLKTQLGGKNALSQGVNTYKCRAMRAKQPGKVLAGFIVPPAWDGRVPVPETIQKRSGPKARRSTD